MKVSTSMTMLAEQRPGGIGQPVRLAVAAAEQIHDGLGRQLLHRVLDGTGVGLVQQPAVVDQEVRGDRQQAGRGEDARADVIVTVLVGADDRSGTEVDGALGDQIRSARGMDADQQQHRRRLIALVADLEPCPNAQ